MAVPGNDDIESRSFGLQIQLREIVQYVDGNAARFEDFSLRQLARPRIFVDISANGGYGRNGCELRNDFRRADVTCMDDVVRSA